MNRKFPPLSKDFKRRHEKNQERIAEKVERRQAAKTKDYKAGLLKIQEAQEKVNSEV